MTWPNTERRESGGLKTKTKEVHENQSEERNFFATKVRCLYQCSKMQFITFQNFHIQTWFSQFLWFFSLKCWFKGQMMSKIHLSLPESKEKRGENSDFWFLGRTVRADIFGRIYLGSKKFSQMAAFVGKSKNIESSLNLNNYCQISIQLACLT